MTTQRFHRAARQCLRLYRHIYTYWEDLPSCHTALTGDKDKVNAMHLLQPY